MPTIIYDFNESWCCVHKALHTAEARQGEERWPSTSFRMFGRSNASPQADL